MVGRDTIDAYVELIEKISQDEDLTEEERKEDIEYMEKRMDSMRRYFNAVFEHVVGGETQKLLCSGGLISAENMKDRIMSLDDARKKAHDVVIDSCAILNRRCEYYGVEPFCPAVQSGPDGQYVNRGEIADFVGKFVYNVFQKGIHGLSLEEMIEKHDIKYGDRTSLDAAFVVAKDYEKRDPSDALKKEELIKKVNEIRKEKMNAKRRANSETQAVGTNKIKGLH